MQNKKNSLSHNGLLPNAYQQVEYLKSTRTQCILTDYIPKKNTKLVSDVKFAGTFYNIATYGGIATPFGLAGTSLANECSCNFGSQSSEGNILYCWFAKGYDSTNVYYLTINNTIKTTRNTIIGDRTGKASWGSVSINLPVATADCINKITIFGQTDKNGNVKPFTGYAEMYLYNFKAYESDILMLDLVPCYRKSDGEIGLYDLISKKFYTNIGTGVFSKGGNVYE